ncbi:MAG: isochorismatase family protein, partial [Anaerolineaceae bacterium]
AVRRTHGAAVVGELWPLPGDIVLPKQHIEFFSRYRLPGILRGLGVEHVVVSGVTTEYCVRNAIHSPLRDHIGGSMYRSICTSSFHDLSTASNRYNVHILWSALMGYVHAASLRAGDHTTGCSEDVNATGIWMTSASGHSDSPTAHEAGILTHRITRTG